MRMTTTIMLLVVFLLSASAWAGDLTTDNLTVSSNVVLNGTLSIQIAPTNGSATGGTITTNGNYRIHTFTNNGTFEVSSCTLSCDVLVVAGGGGGGGNYHGGGGGAGGLIYTSSYAVAVGEHSVIIGAGGTSANQAIGGNGGNSVFSDITATGGGGGGSADVAGGANGGSGGGAPWHQPSVGQGVTNQGNDGGLGFFGAPNYGSGGGGGAGAVGGVGTNTTGGNGGDGLEFSQFNGSGSPAGWFAGGGGGATAFGGTPGSGGKGGGSAGSYVDASNAEANTGGGGGGSERQGSTGIGGFGGSGIVIVRYLPASGSSSSNVTTLTVSSNGINQASASGSNVFMSKVGIGTDTPAEKLHVAGNVKIDGTNIVSSMTLGGETRTNWPNVAVGALIASNNLSDVADSATARANLGLGSAATNDAGVFLTPSSDGSQLTNITAAQVGALSTNAGALIAANNLSELSATAATARSNLGLGSAAINDASAFLSTTGGVVNGNVNINGSVSVDAPAGDVPMGVYTNQ